MNDPDLNKDAKKIINRYRIEGIQKVIMWMILAHFGLLALAAFNIYYFLITDYTVPASRLHELLEIPGKFIRDFFSLPMKGYSFHQIETFVVIILGIFIASFVIFTIILCRDQLKDLSELYKSAIGLPKESALQKMSDQLLNDRIIMNKEPVAELLRYGGNNAIEPLVKFISRDLERHQLKTARKALQSLTIIGNEKILKVLNDLIEKEDLLRKRLSRSEENNDYTKSEVESYINELHEAYNNLRSKFD